MDSKWNNSCQNSEELIDQNEGSEAMHECKDLVIEDLVINDELNALKSWC